MKFATYKQLNLIKLKRVLRSYPYLSFYHFNNINQAEWNLVKGKINNLLTSKSLSLKEEKEKNCFKEVPWEKRVSVQKVEDSKVETGRDSQLWRNENQIRFLVVNSKKILKANSVDLKEKHVFLRLKEKTSCLSSLKEEKGNLNPKGDFGNFFSTEREYKREFVERFFLEGPTLLVGSKSFGSFQSSLRELLKTKKLLLIGGFLEDSKMNPLDLKKVVSLDPVAEKRKLVDTLTHALHNRVSIFNQPFYNLVSTLQLLTNLPDKGSCLEKEKSKPVEK